MARPGLEFEHSPAAAALCSCDPTTWIGSAEARGAAALAAAAAAAARLEPSMSAGDVVFSLLASIFMGACTVTHHETVVLTGATERNHQCLSMTRALPFT